MIFEPLPDDDPRQRKPDISLAKAVLGWEPRTCLRDGLLRTAEYFEGKISFGSRPLRPAELERQAVENAVMFTRGT